MQAESERGEGVLSVERVLYDSASDSDEIKEKFKNNLGIEVKASFNPRGKKEITENVPRGIAKITPYGIPVCKGGYEMEYQGLPLDRSFFAFVMELNLFLHQGFQHVFFF